MSRRPSLPEPIGRSNPPYHLPELGWWLILCDCHLPEHDRVTLQLALAEARRLKVKGVLLNGDTLNFTEISRFDPSPQEPRFQEEIKKGTQFLAWLRDRLPKAVIVWKDGNHEVRVHKYLITKAPALFGLKALSLPSLLGFDDYGIEYVEDRRVVRAGNLNIIHGHEYKGGASSMNPAMTLFRRAKADALCGHHHQTHEHHEPTLAGTTQSAWTVGWTPTTARSAAGTTVTLSSTSPGVGTSPSSTANS